MTSLSFYKRVLNFQAVEGDGGENGPKTFCHRHQSHMSEGNEHCHMEYFDKLINFLLSAFREKYCGLHIIRRMT